MQNKGLLGRLRRRKSKPKPTIYNIRGIPTEVCFCGSKLFNVHCMFEDSEISLYFLDATCALCDAEVTVPCPADKETPVA